MAYTIQEGDTLSKIATQQGITVSELQKLNPNITDPNKIYAGQSLNLATPTTGNIPIAGSTTGATYNSGTGQINLPQQEQINPDLSTAAGAMAAQKMLLDENDKRIAEDRARQERIDKENREYKEKQSGIVGLIKGIGQKRTDELTDLGFEPTAMFAQQKAVLAEVDALYTDYNAAVAARDQQISDVYGRPGQSMDFQNNSIAQINRNANVVLTQKSSNINSKLAVMEAAAGQWENAQKFVDKSISDYTAGLTADYNMLESFIDDNNDLISSLGTEYTNALNSRKSLILDQISQAATDKQNEITNELNKYKATTDRMQVSGISGTTTGFSSAKIESSLREDATDLIYNQGKTPEEAFKQLRTLYSQTEASDDAINALLGITPQATTEISQATKIEPTTTTRATQVSKPLGRAVSTIFKQSPIYKAGDLLAQGIYKFFFEPVKK